MGSNDDTFPRAVSCRGLNVKEAPPNRGARGEGPKDRPLRVATVRTAGTKKPAPPPPRRPGAPPLDLQRHFAGTSPRASVDPAIESFIDKLRTVDTQDELQEWFTAFKTVFSSVKKERKDDPQRDD